MRKTTYLTFAFADPSDVVLAYNIAVLGAVTPFTALFVRVRNTSKLEQSRMSQRYDWIWLA
jgi:hypothetical protein